MNLRSMNTEDRAKAVSELTAKLGVYLMEVDPYCACEIAGDIEALVVRNATTNTFLNVASRGWEGRVEAMRGAINGLLLTQPVVAIAA